MADCSRRTREAIRWSTGEKGILITVADTGPGIAPEARAHLFDAFITTKGIHGTGLGLWISCRIVHKHRRYIKAFNAVRDTRGAVFQLWLPVDLALSAHEPWHIIGNEPGLGYFCYVRKRRFSSLQEPIRTGLDSEQSPRYHTK